MFRHRRVITMLFLGFSAGIPLLLIFSSLSLWLREAGADRASVLLAIDEFVPIKNKDVRIGRQIHDSTAQGVHGHKEEILNDIGVYDFDLFAIGV